MKTRRPSHSFARKDQNQSTGAHHEESAASSAAALDSAAPPTNAHLIVFAVAATAIFALSFDSTLVPIALREIGEGVGVTTPSRLSWISTLYTIAMAASVVAVGRIGDRTGRRRTFLFGFSCFVLGAMICGSATSFTQLLIGRVVQGTGSACVFPSSLGLVLAAWPADQATKAIAWWTAVGGVAGALGPSVGSALVDTLGWRATFLAHVAVGVPALVAARRVLVDTERKSASSLPDIVGSLLVALLLGPLALTLAQARTWGLGDRRLIVAYAVAAIAAPWLAWRCYHHPAPVIEPRMLGLRTYRRTVVLCMLGAGGIFAHFAMLPQFIGRVWDYSTFGVGMAVVPFSIGATISAVLGGRISARVDEKWILFGGFAMMLGSMLWLHYIPGREADYWVELFPPVLVTGFGGWGMVLSMLNSIGARELDNSNYGVGMGIMMTTRQVGSLAGVATAFGILGGTQLAPTDAYDRIREVWLLLVPVFALGLLGTARLPKRH